MTESDLPAIPQSFRTVQANGRCRDELRPANGIFGLINHLASRRRSQRQPIMKSAIRDLELGTVRHQLEIASTTPCFNVLRPSAGFCLGSPGTRWRELR